MVLNKQASTESIQMPCMTWTVEPHAMLLCHLFKSQSGKFLCRLATLEKLGLFSDEQEASQSALSEALNGLELFRSAIEVQVDKIEKRITMAEKLNKQLDDIHKVGGEKSIKTAEDRWNSQFKQHKAEVAKLSTKIEEYDVATLQARKVNFHVPYLNFFCIFQSFLSFVEFLCCFIVLGEYQPSIA